MPPGGFQTEYLSGEPNCAFITVVGESLTWRGSRAFCSADRTTTCRSNVYSTAAKRCANRSAFSGTADAHSHRMRLISASRLAAYVRKVLGERRAR